MIKLFENFNDDWTEKVRDFLEKVSDFFYEVKMYDGDKAGGVSKSDDITNEYEFEDISTFIYNKDSRKGYFYIHIEMFTKDPREDSTSLHFWKNRLDYLQLEKYMCQEINSIFNTNLTVNNEEYGDFIEIDVDKLKDLKFNKKDFDLFKDYERFGL